jgi:peptide/nickel transport system permease protein
MSAGAGGGSLRRYMVTRLLLTIPMLLILLTVVFLLLRVAPGDPLRATLGDRLSPEEIAVRSEALGFNDPILVQYGRYLGGVLTGDFGDPITDRRTTLGVIRDTFPATLELTLFAMGVAIGVGVLVGAVSGRLRDTPFDVGGRLFGVLIYAAPIFWLGVLAQLVFSLPRVVPDRQPDDRVRRPRDITGLHVLDSILTLDGSALLASLHHLILPGTTLGLVIGGSSSGWSASTCSRPCGPTTSRPRTRGGSVSAPSCSPRLQERARPGRHDRGAAVRLLLGGAILTERVFSWPGMGTAILRFLEARDYVGVQGIVTFFAIVVVVVSLLIDLINGLVDPRIRY